MNSCTLLAFTPTSLTPTLLIERARLWAMRRRIEAQGRQQAAAPTSVARAVADESPVV